MHPEIDRFAHLDSAIHRWDARWKLASLILVMLSMGIERPGARVDPSWARDLPPAAGSLALSLGILAASRIPIGFVARRMRWIIAFLAAVLVLFPLTHAGSGPALDGISFSRSGMIIGTLVAVRALAMVIIVFPAFGTSRFDVTMKALRQLRVPARLVHLVLFTYRYLFVYLDQSRRMATALRARGFRPRTDLRTLRTLGNGLGVLLVGSIDRTVRIQGAMRCRGFTGTFRTLDEFSSRPADVLLSLAVLGAGGALLVWRMR